MVLDVGEMHVCPLGLAVGVLALSLRMCFLEKTGGQIFSAHWETAVANLSLGDELCLLALLGFIPADSDFPCSLKAAR